MMSPDEELQVSVLIPTIGRGALLTSCLHSVIECHPRASEVVIVDQSGSDEVTRIAASFASHSVRLIVDAGRGIGRGVNTGLREARNDVVLITHDDCRVATDWVGTAAQLVADRPDDIITGRVIPVGDFRHVPSERVDDAPRDYTGDIDENVLSAPCMCCSRRVLLEFGGFDERFVRAAEDTDLSHRWLKAGRTIRYAPDLVVWHEDWRTPAQLRAAYRRYAHGDGMFYAKHLRAGDLTMLRRIAFHFAWALQGEVAMAGRLGQRAWDPRIGTLRALARGLKDGWRVSEPSSHT